MGERVTNLAALSQDATKLVDWIERFVSKFVKLSIRIECVSAAEYDPLYNGIISMYRQSIREDNFEKERTLLEQAEHKYECSLKQYGLIKFGGN